jgi:hypothetical protein
MVARTIYFNVIKIIKIIFELQAVTNSTRKTKRIIKEFLVKFSMSTLIGIEICIWYTCLG